MINGQIVELVNITPQDIVETGAKRWEGRKKAKKSLKKSKKVLTKVQGGGNIAKHSREGLKKTGSAEKTFGKRQKRS